MRCAARVHIWASLAGVARPARAHRLLGGGAKKCRAGGAPASARRRALRLLAEALLWCALFTAVAYACRRFGAPRRQRAAALRTLRTLSCDFAAYGTSWSDDARHAWRGAVCPALLHLIRARQRRADVDSDEPLIYYCGRSTNCGDIGARLSGILATFAVALHLNRPFRIVWAKDALVTYLRPVEHDWVWFQEYIWRKAPEKRVLLKAHGENASALFFDELLGGPGGSPGKDGRRRRQQRRWADVPRNTAIVLLGPQIAHERVFRSKLLHPAVRRVLGADVRQATFCMLRALFRPGIELRVHLDRLLREQQQLQQTRHASGCTRLIGLHSDAGAAGHHDGGGDDVGGDDDEDHGGRASASHLRSTRIAVARHALQCARSRHPSGAASASSAARRDVVFCTAPDQLGGALRAVTGQDAPDGNGQRVLALNRSRIASVERSHWNPSLQEQLVWRDFFMLSEAHMCVHIGSSNGSSNSSSGGSRFVKMACAASIRRLMGEGNCGSGMLHVSAESGNAVNGTSPGVCREVWPE